MTVTAAWRSRQETALRVLSVPFMLLAGGLLAGLTFSALTLLGVLVALGLQANR